MAVPSVIKKFIRQYIDSSEGEEQVSSKAPVDSVNDKTGSVSVEEYSDSKASDAAPVQSVNGETGDVEVEEPSFNPTKRTEKTISTTEGAHSWGVDHEYDETYSVVVADNEDGEYDTVEEGIPYSV